MPSIGDAQGAGTITNDDQPAGRRRHGRARPRSFAGATITATVANGPGNPPRLGRAVQHRRPADTAAIGVVLLERHHDTVRTGITDGDGGLHRPDHAGHVSRPLLCQRRLHQARHERVDRRSCPAPTLHINDVSVTEGHAGTTAGHVHRHALAGEPDAGGDRELRDRERLRHRRQRLRGGQRHADLRSVGGDRARSAWRLTATPPSNRTRRSS